jgi:hypothetical protein
MRCDAMRCNARSGTICCADAARSAERIDGAGMPSVAPWRLRTVPEEQAESRSRPRAHEMVQAVAVACSHSSQARAHWGDALMQLRYDAP